MENRLQPVALLFKSCDAAPRVINEEFRRIRYLDLVVEIELAMEETYDYQFDVWTNP